MKAWKGFPKEHWMYWVVSSFAGSGARFVSMLSIVVFPQILILPFAGVAVDRVLPKKRLYRGFGALTFGGLAGMIVSLPALVAALTNGLPGHDLTTDEDYASVEEIAEELERKLLELAYPPEKNGAEGLDYMEQVMKHMSAKTIWRVFDSCSDDAMPKPFPAVPTEIQYWYGSLEKKAGA